MNSFFYVPVRVVVKMHQKLCLIFISAVTTLSNVYCLLEKEITINVDPLKQDCFYQTVKKGHTIDIEYQVISGGHGDLDITFHIIDPTGRVLISEFKKSENNHRVDAQGDGDYKICFDNTFSSYNAKTVFFELIVDKEGDEWNWGSNEDYKFEGINSNDIYELKIEDVQEIVSSVRNHLTKVRHLQDLIKSTEARDRNTAEEMYFRVNAYSIFTLIVISVVGTIQLVMVKSLFDDHSKVHKFWKHLDGKS